MNHYHYTGAQDQGSPIAGWLMADDRDEAIRTLRSRGIKPYSVQKGPGYIPLKVPVSELLVALRELSSLRRSGMALDESLDSVLDTTEHPVLHGAWSKVSDMVRGGMTLSDAMAAVPDAFPRYAVPLVKLGEANGELTEAVSIVADRLEEESQLQGEVKSAMAYPLFLLVVSASVLLFLFMVVIPKFGAMVSGDGAIGSMGVLLSISSFLRNYFWLWGGLLFVGACSGLYGWRTGKIQSHLFTFVYRIPGVRDVMMSWEIVQFCGGVSRLLPGGVSLLDALRLSSESLSREETKQILAKIIDQVRQGGSLGSALKEQDYFPKLMVKMVAVGEKSSSLAMSMGEVAKLYERRMRENIRKVLNLLEPTVIVTMGLVIGGIMVSLLSAIITMNDIPI